MIYCTSVYEDEITHQVMLRIYNLFHDYFSEEKPILCNGFGKIKKRINAYNHAAKHGYYFIITDLDDKYICAPSLVKDWLPNKLNKQFLFRVAVHEIESWLLADRENFASFFSINKNLIPLKPDDEIDPKSIVISLAKRSKKRNIREALIPIDSYASIGPGYNTQFLGYIRNIWNINSARRNSPSLDKTIKSLEKLVYSKREQGNGE
ncbi:MAG: DUF4276 family protein [Treponema sp.]|jgi:hypothetical protein|nr:DUF4276 family protein [Treponema sp.]